MAEPKQAKRNKSKEAKTELPPNEKVQKYPDELYGDTEMPANKRHGGAGMDEEKKKGGSR